MGQRINVPKEIRNRFSNIFGGGNNQARVEDVDNHGMGDDQKKLDKKNMEEKMMISGQQYVEGKGEDPYSYVEIDDVNTQPNRNVNFTTIKDETKTHWTANGPQ